jgi:hypothetical protein
LLPWVLMRSVTGVGRRRWRVGPGVLRRLEPSLRDGSVRALTYRRRREPLFKFRLPRLARLTLEAEARRIGVSPSAYVRALVIANLTQRGENSGVARSGLHKNFDRAIKRFILTYQKRILPRAALLVSNSKALLSSYGLTRGGMRERRGPACHT